MTHDEAVKVGVVALNADNGCSVCVHSAVTQLRELLPDVDWRSALDEAVRHPAVDYFERNEVADLFD